MKIIHGLEQGSDAWLARRRTTRNASDAPAMMGVSPYVSRTEFIRQRATGIEREIDSATQAIFDKGHAVEPALRALAEATIGEDLYPVVADSDDGYLSASLDGVTLAEDVIFEGKQSNVSKQACIARGEIPPQDYWQIVQQFAVCDAATRCLYECGDGTDGGTASLWIERAQVEHDIPKLIAGWEQFEADLAAYEPEQAKAAVVAAPIAGFGALSVRVEGRVLASNLDAFKANADAFLKQLPKPQDLQTDQDFADADAAVKACSDAEARIKAAQEAALADMEDVDTLLRTAGSISEAIRAARLALEKAVKAEKDNRRAQIVDNGVKAVRDHYDAINATLGQHRIQPPQSLSMDIGLAIKGKKSLSSMQDAVGTAAANAKIAASQQSERVRTNMALLDKHAAHASLFPDRVQLCASKDIEDLRNLVATRITEHEANEEKKREDIRQEELASCRRSPSRSRNRSRRRCLSRWRLHRRGWDRSRPQPTTRPWPPWSAPVRRCAS